jgi:hypothetical protein
MEGALPSRDSKQSNLEKNLTGHPQTHLMETMAGQKRSDLQQHVAFPLNGGSESKISPSRNSGKSLHHEINYYSPRRKEMD